MRRRQLFALFGGAVASIGVARAEGERIRRIGALMTVAESDPEGQGRLHAFREGLAAHGWIEGRNVQVEYRYISGGGAGAQARVADLVASAPDLILATGRAVLASVQRETRTIPTVFVAVPDPVGDGFVASLAHPGGNLTGLTNFEFAMGAKWLEILREMAPRTRRVAVLFHADTAPNARYFLESIAAAPIALAVETAAVSDVSDLEHTLSAFHGGANDALLVVPGLFTAVHYAQIVDLAARQRLPAIYPFRFFVARGGLVSYGVDMLDLFRRSSEYVDRILRGDRPDDLPVQAPTKFELAVNLRAAGALGLTIPPSLLARADEVIE